MEDRERDYRMSDLIRRSDAIDALKNALCELGGDEWGDGELGVHADDIDAIINDIPTIEPKRGEWIDRGMRVPSSWVKKCSLCGHETDTWRWCKFCPNCGARMKGADDE